MQYRIRKDIYNNYNPERRGWDTLFFWVMIENSAAYSFRAFGSYTEEKARAVIEYDKDLRSRKEKIIKYEG